MLAPCKGIQEYRIPSAGVNRSRTQQTLVNQDSSCAVQAGGRRLHSQGTTAAGGWQTSEGSEGEQSDFPMGKIPLTALGRRWQQDQCMQSDSNVTAQRAAAWCPSQLHGTARWATAAPSSLRGTRCTDLPAAWHSWGQSEPPACSWAGSATARPERCKSTLTGEQGTPSAKQGGRQRGHGRGEEQLNGPRPHGACGNRHQHTLPKHLLPPRWHGASARGGHGSGGGGGEHARARSKKRHVCAWQHNREQVTSAPAVALLQEASTQASDAALPGEKIKHPPLLPLTIPLWVREKGPLHEGGWVPCCKMMARWHHGSAFPPCITPKAK